MLINQIELKIILNNNHNDNNNLIISGHTLGFLLTLDLLVSDNGKFSYPTSIYIILGEHLFSVQRAKLNEQSAITYVHLTGSNQ